MTFTVNIAPDPATQAQLDRIEAALTQLLTKDETIMADLTSLTAGVTNNTSVIQSAVTLLNNIGAQLKAAGTDPVALAALAAQLSKDDTALAAAVVANTPAGTTTPPAA